MGFRKQIQTEEQNGHDPMEDASAALELAQYFIKAGPRKVISPCLHYIYFNPPTQTTLYNAFMKPDWLIFT